jgi:two-component system, chemotaxis family, sensor kinase CheA
VTELYINEPMLDMFLFETTQLIEQLEQSILTNEKSNSFTQDVINEIFRIMHTIKGSSAMMMFENISTLAHSIEDLFYFLREEKPQNIDCSDLSDLMLESADLIKAEIEKIKKGNNPDGDFSSFIQHINDLLLILKPHLTSPDSTRSKEQVLIGEKECNKDFYKNDISDYGNFYKAVICFEEGCEMENIRAFAVIHKLKQVTGDFHFIPEDIIENDESINAIRQDGFMIFLKTDYSYEKLHDFFMETVFLKDLELTQLEDERELLNISKEKQKTLDNSLKLPLLDYEDKEDKEQESKDIYAALTRENIISVSVSKLDKLMDVVGEMVISEAMVIQNPDLNGLKLNNFRRAAQQLHKITGELQDLVMSIRMVPLATTFQKMNRIVRDMSKMLGKDVHLELVGEDTEVDKNIIEHVSDPLMHIIRNSIDHGIETPEERENTGKPKSGTITLEARNVGGDVLVIVKDDGKGLDRNKILQKAKQNNLLKKPENEMSIKEIYNLIFLPGFSTNDEVTKFSGRGVGMDVVIKNIGTVGGTVSVDSIEGIGTTVTLKMPLTLAIIDGINVKVGNSCYTIPTISIKEFFCPKENDIIMDPDGNEMIMVRGVCYPILRLYEQYNIRTDVTDLMNGILIMVEAEDKFLCLFADELLGQQQVVVKTLPEYIRSGRNIRGLTGCTLLGDGSISLIMDIAKLVY